jgi:serine/threonine-protein kinase
VDIDFRADIYSLGATMYHLVTGQPPFDGDTPSAVMHKHLKQPLVPPDHLNTALSAGLGEIIEVAMAKNRDDRYPSTEDMLEDLRAVRKGEPPIHARRQVDIEALANMDRGARTVDIEPQVFRRTLTWSSPIVITLLAVCGFSLVLNIIFLLITLTRP